MGMSNCYDDARRADAYAKLEFPGTYYLAYRDLPAILGAHVDGKRALDFGCGAGRSTRFLRQHGFDVVGVDISADMIRKAREADPAGDYRLLGEGGLGQLEPEAYDLVLSAFTFDNIPTLQKKVQILQDLGRLLGSEGRIVSIVSSPEIYWHEWVSFSTRDYPENRRALTGGTVRIVITEIEDTRPVEDILWTDEAYEETFALSGLEPVATYRPLGRANEPYPWVNETRIAPWTLYVLKRSRQGRRGATAAAGGHLRREDTSSGRGSAAGVSC